MIPRNTSSRILHVFFALSLLFSSANGASINFDNLSATGNPPVPLGYGGFSWSNFYYLNASTYGTSGYQAGMVSANNVAYNGWGDPASLSSTEPFNLVSAYLTGAWNHNLQVTVTGFSGSTQVGTQTVTVSAYAPTLFTFNFNNITSVSFSATGGTAAYGSPATHFAMDNLVVTPVPEPSTVMLGGLGVLALLRRRRD